MAVIYLIVINNRGKYKIVYFKLVGNRILNKNWYSYRCLVNRINQLKIMPSSQNLKNFGKINVKIFEPANEDSLKNNILNSSLNSVGIEDH